MGPDGAITFNPLLKQSIRTGMWEILEIASSCLCELVRRVSVSASGYALTLRVQVEIAHLLRWALWFWFLILH
jgi:hypothetical protein